VEDGDDLTQPLGHLENQMKDEALAVRCRALKLLLSDVDGVMTDGTVLLLPDGREAKAFHIRDGLAVVLARHAGLRTGVVTGRGPSDAVTRRTADLAMDVVRRASRTRARRCARSWPSSTCGRTRSPTSETT
jgi:hypothetical protein